MAFTRKVRAGVVVLGGAAVLVATAAASIARQNGGSRTPTGTAECRRALETAKLMFEVAEALLNASERTGNPAYADAASPIMDQAEGLLDAECKV